MAGNKQVPLRWGEGGPIIGTAMIDENGIVMGEIEITDPLVRTRIFGGTDSLSIFTPNDKPDDGRGD